MAADSTGSKPKGDEHAVATALGLRMENGSAVLDKKSLLKSLGGTIGILESTMPSFIFLMAWLTTKSPTAAVIGAFAPVVAFGSVRLVRRESLMQVLSGALVAAFSVYLALRPGGSTEEFFLPGLLTNLAYLAVLLISVVVRWPIVGLLFGLIFQHGTSWRKHRKERSPYTAATLALSAVFAVRLVFEVPLFLAGALEALAVVKLILGLPLYALGLWTAWLLARKGIPGHSN